jgi:hypothetical protein
MSVCRFIEYATGFIAGDDGTVKQRRQVLGEESENRVG